MIPVNSVPSTKGSAVSDLMGVAAANPNSMSAHVCVSGSGKPVKPQGAEK